MTSGKPLTRVLRVFVARIRSDPARSTASGEMGIGRERSTSDGVHHAACPLFLSERFELWQSCCQCSQTLRLACIIVQTLHFAHPGCHFGQHSLIGIQECS
jgi:hypothetical protein